MSVIATVNKRTSGEGAGYYLEEQIGYYGGHGVEEPGRWHDPNGLFDATPHGEEIGKKGAQALYNLFDGKSPDDPAEPLRQNAGTVERAFSGAKNNGGNPKTVVVTDIQLGFDKGVSILWAAGTPEIKAQIRAAIDATGEALFNVLQDHLAFGRMGKDSLIKVPGKILAATFLHKASRPSEAGKAGADATAKDLLRYIGDPQLHLHIVVPNVCQRPDGSWGAIDAREFLERALDLGVVARTVFMAELKSRLPVRFVEDPKEKPIPLPRLVGIPQELVQTLSTRTENAREVLAEAVAADPSIANDPKKMVSLTKEIVQGQRNAKNRIDAAGEELDRDKVWAQAIADLGFDPSQVLFPGEPEEAQTPRPLEDVTREALAKLFDQEALVPTSKVIAAVYHAHAYYGSGETAKAALRSLIDAGDLVRVEVDGVNHWTTRQTLEDEVTVGDLALAMASDSRYRAPAEALETHSLRMAEKGVVLREEQRVALRRVITDPGTLIALEGAAGSGKSFVLTQASKVWEAAGFKPVVLAIAHETSRRLAGECGGIGHDAIQPWLEGVAEGRITLDRDAVVIVDEAAQLSTRQTKDLLEVAGRVGARVVLTGDRLQVKPIGAGAGLELVTRAIGGMRLEETVRQHDEWAREAATDLSHGRGDLALTRFEEKGLVQIHSDVTRPRSNRTMHHEMVDSWFRFLDNPANAGKTTLLMAIKRTDVQEISEDVRWRLIQRGTLGPVPRQVELVDEEAANAMMNRLLRTEEDWLRVEEKEIPRETVEIRVGEQVRFRRRNEQLGVVNGVTGKVLNIHDGPEGPVLDIEISGDGGPTRIIAVDTHAYPYLTHAYASTVYAAQGATVDAAWVAVGKGWKRDLAYVAGSRSREPTEWHVDSRAIADSLRNRVPLSERRNFRASLDDIREELGRLLSRRSLKRIASDYIAPMAAVSPAAKMELSSTEAARSDEVAGRNASAMLHQPGAKVTKPDGGPPPAKSSAPATKRKYHARAPKIEWVVRPIRNTDYRRKLNEIMASPALRRRVIPVIETLKWFVVSLGLSPLFRRLSARPLLDATDTGVAKLAEALVTRSRREDPQRASGRTRELSDRIRSVAVQEAPVMRAPRAAEPRL